MLLGRKTLRFVSSDGVRPEADHLTSDVIPLSTLALVLEYRFSVQCYRFSVQANTIGVKPEAKDLETDQSGLLEGIS